MKELRFLISDELYKKLKIVCVKNDLSLPKQMSNVVSNFVDMMETNEKRLEHAKKK